MEISSCLFNRPKQETIRYIIRKVLRKNLLHFSPWFEWLIKWNIYLVVITFKALYLKVNTNTHTRTHTSLIVVWTLSCMLLKQHDLFATYNVSHYGHISTIYTLVPLDIRNLFLRRILKCFPYVLQICIVLDSMELS